MSYQKREPVSVRIEVDASELPAWEERFASNCTIGLSEALQRRLYKELKLVGGDTVILVSGDREITGTVLAKPTDALLIIADVDLGMGNV